MRNRKIDWKWLALGLAAAGCGGNNAQNSAFSPMGGDMMASSLGSGAPKGDVAKKQPDLGLDANLNGFRPFTDQNAWNLPVDKSAVDPLSDKIIARIGLDKPLHPDFGAGKDNKPFGIPYVVVSGDAPRVPVEFEAKDESDAGPYPIPLEAPIEPGSDKHVLVLDRDGMKLYETWNTERNAAGFKAGSGAVWDTKTDRARKAGWTSADAAGLPIFPGLVRYDEVAIQKEIRHALRFTVAKTRKAFVPPASHFASKETDADLPPMGMRVRLKKNFDVAKYPESAQVVLRALKKYGMILADNGSDWFLSGTADTHWKDDELEALKKVKGSDFEVVKMPKPTTEIQEKPAEGSAALKK